MEIKSGKCSQQRSSESSSKQGASSAIVTPQLVYSNPLMAEKNDEALSKEVMRMKSKKDPKCEVEFYQVDPSAERAVNRDEVLDMDNKFFAHLVKPPVEYDSTFQSENPFSQYSLEAPRELTQEERSDWQQGLFECQKTDPEFMRLAAVCPDIAEAKNYQESERIWIPRSVFDPYSRALCRIFLRIFSFACCLLWFMKCCTSVVIHKSLLIVFSIIPSTCAACMLIFRYHDRKYLIKNASLKYSDISSGPVCDICCIPICCQPCNECQMHTEIKHQQRIRHL